MASTHLVVTFLLIVIILGSLSVSSTILLSPHQSLAQTTKKVFNDSDFATLYSSPDSYVDSKVNITGKIFNFPPSGIRELKALQMYQAGNRDRNVVIFYKGNTPQLSENDCVRVVGTSAKQQQYANTFGATLTATIINANSVEKIDCINVINPAIKTVFVKETLERWGISIFLNKVEFSDKNTAQYLNANVNKEPQFSSYQNSDYKIRIACPTNWIKQVSSNTSTFSLVCRPPETNLTTIGLIAKANTAYIPSSKQKQYLSSVLSSLRNDTKLQIINSSYTTISNNSAVQVFLKSSNGNQVKRLDIVTNFYNYTIYYEADPEHFNKYLSMGQRVMNSFQFTGPKLPDLPQLPELPPLLP